MPAARTHLDRFFWGFVFTMLDPPVGQIDLLPDSIGYCLIAFGSGGLIKYSRKFVGALGLSGILVVLSLLEDVRPLVSTIPTLPNFETFRIIVDCAMVSLLLGGIIALAISYGRLDIASFVRRRRAVYVGLLLGLVALGLAMKRLGLSLEEADGLAASILLIIVGAAMLVVLLMTLHLADKVRRELSTVIPELAPNPTPAADV